MKTLVALFLILSLALNATLAWLHRTADTAPQPPSESAAAAPSGRVPAAAQLNPAVWSTLAAAEHSETIKRLQAAGFPPTVVRAILTAQVREAFAARRKALAASSANAPYWHIPRPDPQAAAAARELQREEQKMIRELLGEPENEDPLMRATRERGLEFLPAEKAGEIRQILRDFEERRMDVFSAGYMASDREKIAALEKEQRATIARVLTPQELFEYELRTSNTANILREELSAFQPSEQEYRAIFPIRAAFEDRFGNIVSALSQEDMRQRSEASRHMAEQVKAVLAPDRAAEYDRMTDYNYRRTSQLVARLELPPETTSQLYAVQKEFEQRRTELYRGGVSATDRERINAQLTGLQQEAISRVAPLLGGPRGVEAYRQFGGSWINGLVPRPMPTPPAPRR